ncbi:MAG: hypothetical protein Q9227_004014 [Pyrenula ochraceoflavens]
MSFECYLHLHKVLLPPPVPSDRVGEILSRRDAQFIESTLFRKQSRPLVSSKFTKVLHLTQESQHACLVALIAFLVLTLMIWHSIARNRVSRRSPIVEEYTNGHPHYFPAWVSNSVARSTNVLEWRSVRLDTKCGASPTLELRVLNNVTSADEIISNPTSKAPVRESAEEDPNTQGEDEEGAWLPIGDSVEDAESVSHWISRSHLSRHSLRSDMSPLSNDTEVTEWLQENTPNEDSTNALSAAQSSTTTEPEDSMSRRPSISEKVRDFTLEPETLPEIGQILEAYTIKEIRTDKSVKYSIKKLSARHHMTIDTDRDSQIDVRQEMRMAHRMGMLEKGFRYKIKELLYERNRLDPERRLYEWSLLSLRADPPEETEIFQHHPTRVNILIKRSPRNELYALQAPPVSTKIAHLGKHDKFRQIQETSLVDQTKSAGSSQQFGSKKTTGSAGKIIGIGALRKRLNSSQRS